MSYAAPGPVLKRANRRSQLPNRPSGNARLEWFCRLATAEQRRRAVTGPLPAPLTVEIHPYIYRHGLLPCSNDCGHCTRRDDRADLQYRRVPGIDPVKLISFIGGLAGRGVRNFVISGNSTEPTCYPALPSVIRAVKDAGLALSVFTNFHRGDRVIEAADCLAAQDVVRVSLDAGGPRSYERVHRPRFRHAFETVMGNIAQLVQERRRLGRHFRVEISFVVTRANWVSTEVRSLVRRASELEVNRVRFTRLLVPQIGNDLFDRSQIPGAAQATEAAALLRELQAETAGSTCEVQVLDEAPQQPHKPFARCHHWKVVAVLGACGRFFPCTSVSLVRLMNRLGRGDINAPDFDFWEFWSDADKWSGLRQGCGGAECTRFEFAVNEELDRLAVGAKRAKTNRAL